MGILIGKKGENVKRIERDYGIKIQITPEPSPDRPQERSISLSGHPDAISHAQSDILRQIVRCAFVLFIADYLSLSQLISSFLILVSVFFNIYHTN